MGKETQRDAGRRHLERKKKLQEKLKRKQALSSQASAAGAAVIGAGGGSAEVDAAGAGAGSSPTGTAAAPAPAAVDAAASQPEASAQVLQQKIRELQTVHHESDASSGWDSAGQKAKRRRDVAVPAYWECLQESTNQRRGGNRSRAGCRRFRAVGRTGRGGTHSLHVGMCEG